MCNNIWFGFLGIEYFLTEKNKLCSENGNIAVDDFTTCKKAARNLGYPFGGAEDLAGWPKGCYASGGEFVYFNKHIYGSKNDRARQICDRKGKGLRSFSLLCIYWHKVNRNA